MHTFALVLLRHFLVRHFPVCRFPVLQIYFLFIYLLQTTVGPYTYRTVENTQYKAGNRIKKTGITHETKKLKSKKLKSKNTANYYTPARYLKQPH